ncbi:MAG TPA: DUF3108 domain-containing protein [Rhodocyclaceae bacterium]|nr:DUF3108 domain-containing protein [Rhodocyclaceae bacterium]
MPGSMRRSGFALALALSLLLHLALLSSPGWRLPTFGAAARLQAQLLPRPVQQAPQPPPQPAVRRQPPRRLPPPVRHRARPPALVTAPAPIVAPATIAQPSLSPPPEQAAPAAEPMAAPPPPAIAPEVPPPEPQLPRHGRIRFSISRGDQGFVVGQAVHTWHREGKTYALSSVTETTGLAALFRPARVVQESEGEISAEGLKPLEYRTVRNGVAAEAASFDWPGGLLHYSGGREAPLTPGAQDVLSVFYQLGQRLPVARTEVMVATGKKFERYTFDVLGEERLPLAFGEQRVLHLKSVGDGGEVTEIWLGLDLRGLPLKIRYTDRSGESFVQIAEKLAFDDNGPAASGKLPQAPAQSPP